MLWSTAFFLLIKTGAGLYKRESVWVSAVAALFTILITALALTLVNPVYYIHRQNVLGGKSFSDTFRFHRYRAKIHLNESCAAIFNPDDIRAISSLEAVDRASLSKFSSISLVELKVVEENYSLLSLKDEKGKFIFSDAARLFAKAEVNYAGQIASSHLASQKICLIANFEYLPQNEIKPFSRSRRFFDARQKSGLDTRVIQLPSP